MIDNKTFVRELTELLERAKIDKNARYLTAKQIELLYNIPSKTVLNRSNLPTSHNRYIPSLRLKGGRKKYFEKKVFERLFVIGSRDQFKKGGL